VVNKPDLVTNWPPFTVKLGVTTVPVKVGLAFGASVEIELLILVIELVKVVKPVIKEEFDEPYFKSLQVIVPVESTAKVLPALFKVPVKAGLAEFNFKFAVVNAVTAVAEAFVMVVILLLATVRAVVAVAPTLLIKVGSCEVTVLLIFVANVNAVTAVAEILLAVVFEFCMFVILLLATFRAVVAVAPALFIRARIDVEKLELLEIAVANSYNVSNAAGAPPTKLDI
jgi:hypothetical protein